MSGNHAHNPQNYNRAFAIGVVLNSAFIVVELASGILSDSLALIADAGHNLSDVFSLLIATVDLLRDSADLAIDAVPKGIEPDSVREFLLNLNGVADVHDFHIWGMSTTQAALTAHLIIPQPPNHDGFLRALAGQLHHQFGIVHSTIQIERGNSQTRCVTVKSHCV